MPLPPKFSGYASRPKVEVIVKVPSRYYPPKFSGYASRPKVEVIVKVPSRYYQVRRYFLTVLTVAHNRWYRPTLLATK